VTTVRGPVASGLTTFLGPLPLMGAIVFLRVEAHENGKMRKLDSPTPTLEIFTVGRTFFPVMTPVWRRSFLSTSLIQRFTKFGTCTALRSLDC
jgi:hypothetical protein